MLIKYWISREPISDALAADVRDRSIVNFVGNKAKGRISKQVFQEK